MLAEFSTVPFLDPGKAESNLGRLEGRLARSLLAPLASLLAQSPDPDGALNQLERYLQAAPAAVRRDLERYPTALSYLVAIFGYSRSLAEAFLGEPVLPVEFARDRHFTKLKSKEDLMQDFARDAATRPDAWLAAQLARFQQRAYLRIVLKDVLRLSTLAETTLELSALADMILERALDYCRQELAKRYGSPQYRDAQGRTAPSRFSVISLGKLGGEELNYSSDIDLLFLYSHDGETSGGSERDSRIANLEYFIRLAHALTRVLTQTTPAGRLFRLDLRLRPEGEQGDITLSLRAAEEYYERRARDWELQMLLKARHSAGDAELTREFLRLVEPRVYSSAHDFGAILSVLEAREKISGRGRESGGEIDVKRHCGGIRDIEFLTQCLQRLHGGSDPWLRSGGTLHALRKLNDKALLSDRDYATLNNAYELLRTVEHRLQLDLGQQTHRLPADAVSLDRLARRVGLDGSARPSPGAALLARLRRAFTRVDAIHRRVIHLGAPPDSAAPFELARVAAPAPGRGPQSYGAVLEFLSAQAPELASIAKAIDFPARVRPLVGRFFSALLASSERFALASAEPEAFGRALETLRLSEYLGDMLVRNVEDLAALPGEEPPPASGCAQLSMGLKALGDSPVAPPFPWTEEPSLGVREKMAALRREYRHAILALGVRDCLRLDSVFESLGDWSSLAARAISSALVIAGQGLAAASAEGGLVVLALGRLGLREFDLASDADLVFVAARDPQAEASVTPAGLGYWTRLAEKSMDVLASYTSEGAVFAVDTRLRPRGQEGELVVTAPALLRYLAETAQPWEALAYLKAWPVAGDTALGDTLGSRLVATLFERFGRDTQLAAELSQMRRRLETELMAPPSDTKVAPGGYYDVDFPVSYLRLRHGVTVSPGSNLPAQIESLRAASLLGEEDAATLGRGARFLRAVDHAIRLVTGRPARGLPEHVGHLEAVETLVRRWELVESGADLADRLRGVQQEVRGVYHRLLST